MRKLFFATGNLNKLEEIQQLLGTGFELASLKDLAKPIEIEETEDSLEGNAILKAKTILELTGTPCFADDTGLEVEALGGAPGIYSARYAGKDVNAENNMAKLLQALENEDNRTARFKTVVAYAGAEKVALFEGILKGRIARAKTGEKGFGYDPIFIPEGSERSLAEFSSEEKNAISHRGIAMRKFIEFIQQ